MHYKRAERSGEIDKAIRHVAKSGSGTNDRGYRRIRVDGVRVWEHRYVLEQHLGRKLLAHENVHHINGVKDDNRLENLELWIIMQPTGQRAEDLVDWAHKVLEQYGGGRIDPNRQEKD